MSRVRRLERLIQNAERRRKLAADEILKVDAEIRELKRRLAQAQEDERQLVLPLDTRTRGMSEKWAAVLNFMLLRRPNPVSLDEVLIFATQNDLNISRAAARAQLHNYVQRGIVERLSDGLYLPTEAAKAYCDY